MLENFVNIKGRQVQKHDIEANWIKAGNAANPFTPLKGEIIIYDDRYIDDTGEHIVADQVRFKIGDGIRNVNELPFEVQKDLFTLEESVNKEFLSNDYTWIRFNFSSTEEHTIYFAYEDEIEGPFEIERSCRGGVWYNTAELLNCYVTIINIASDDFDELTFDIRTCKYAPVQLVENMYTNEQIDSAIAEATRDFNIVATYEGITTDISYDAYYMVEVLDGAADTTLHFTGNDERGVSCWIDVDLHNNEVFQIPKDGWEPEGSDKVVGLVTLATCEVDYYNETRLHEIEYKYYSPDQTDEIIDNKLEATTANYTEALLELKTSLEQQISDLINIQNQLQEKVNELYSALEWGNF